MPPLIRETCSDRGFTLIELSIVLVVIGLIVGGVLVGQDLVRAAGERAQITQIEKFNQAANTFFGKYGYLPGDIKDPDASAFGFTPRGHYSGEGDGNGLLQGVNTDSAGRNYGYVQGAGETVMFWVDLTTANGMNVNLIDGSFSAATTSSPQTVASTAVGTFFPAGKLGNGNYIYVYNNSSPTSSGNAINYFGLSSVTGVQSPGGCTYCIDSSPGLTVKQAYDIDQKIDDGKPTGGRVIAQYEDGVAFAGSGIGAAPNAASPSASTCYDTSSGSAAYSVAYSGGSNVTCALSFKMQAGD